MLVQLDVSFPPSGVNDTAISAEGARVQIWVGSTPAPYPGILWVKTVWSLYLYFVELLIEQQALYEWSFPDGDSPWGQRWLHLADAMARCHFLRTVKIHGRPHRAIIFNSTAGLARMSPAANLLRRLAFVQRDMHELLTHILQSRQDPRFAVQVLQDTSTMLRIGPGNVFNPQYPLEERIYAFQASSPDINKPVEVPTAKPQRLRSYLQLVPEPPLSRVVRLPPPDD